MDPPVGLVVAGEVDAPHGDPTRHRLLPDGRAHDPPVPLDVPCSPTFTDTTLATDTVNPGRGQPLPRPRPGTDDQDLVAIGDRVRPKPITQRKTAAVRDSVMGAKDSDVDKTSDSGACG